MADGVDNVITVAARPFQPFLRGADPNALAAAPTGQFGQVVEVTTEKRTTLLGDHQSATVIFRRRNGASGAASVDYATADGTALAGTHYTAMSGTIAWADGEDHDQYIYVPILAGGAGQLTFNVNLSNASGPGLGVAASEITINYDGSGAWAGMVGLYENSYEIPSDRGAVLVYFNRSGGSSGTVTLDYEIVDGTAVNGVDFNVAGTGTVTLGHGPKPLVIDIPAQLAEDKQFKIQVSNPTGGAVLGVSEATVTLRAAASAATHAAALAFTPWYVFDAESIALGEQGDTVAGVGAGGDSIVDTGQVFEGTRSVRCHSRESATGFGNWGFSVDLPTVLSKGDTFQYQFSVFLPWNFDAWSPGEGGRLKFFRIRSQLDTGSTNGLIDLYLWNGKESPTADLYYIREVVGQWVGTGSTVGKGRWETFEMRVVLDDVAESSGGTARVMIWQYKNGAMELIQTITDQPTIINATDQITLVYFSTYWNGGAPRDQYCWVDRVVLHNDQSTLIETDAGGNKIIGGVV
jgi:hypothetical protein